MVESFKNSNAIKRNFEHVSGTREFSCERWMEIFQCQETYSEEVQNCNVNIDKLLFDNYFILKILNSKLCKREIQNLAT